MQCSFECFSRRTAIDTCAFWVIRALNTVRIFNLYVLSRVLGC